MQFHTLMSLFIIVLFLVPVSWSQNSPLEGNWILTDGGVEGGEYSVFEVDNRGNTTFSASYPHVIDNQEYIFDVNHLGKMNVNENDQLVYAGLANGEAQGTDGDIKVRLEVGATGIVSTDNNMIAGVWANSEQYTTPSGTIQDQNSLPFILVRKGFDPGTPGEALAGTWEISIQGENLGWTGQVTLNPDGTMIGEYADSGNVPSVPLSGFFAYSEDKQFDFSYTTTTSLPVVGETTFTFSGEGEGNEDNTHIEGVWSFTVEVSGLASKTFNGTFELTKIEETPISNWQVF